MLAAYNGAVSRLELKVDAGVRNVATRVNSASLLLYSRTYMTQVAVQMKLGEFYTLMCKQIGEDRNRLSAAIEKATGKAHKQVRSVLTAGVLSLALSDPKLAEQMVDVVLWVEGNANDLRERFGGVAQDATQQTGQVIGEATRRAGGAFSELKVLAGTLEPGARTALAGLQLSALQAADLERSGLRGARSAAAIARGTVVSAELLVAVGGTYLLSQGLRKSVEAVDATLGAKHEEAVLAVYSASIGVLGGHPISASLAFEKVVSEKRLDYLPETVTPVIRERKITAPDGVETCFLIIDGDIKLKRNHDVDEVRLSLEYFPNIQDLEVVAGVEVLEVK